MRTPALHTSRGTRRRTRARGPHARAARPRGCSLAARGAGVAAGRTPTTRAAARHPLRARRGRPSAGTGQEGVDVDTESFVPLGVRWYPARSTQVAAPTLEDRLDLDHVVLDAAGDADDLVDAAYAVLVDAEV